MSTCTWTNEYGSCETGCGNYFTLDEGSPADNGMVFCCFCGKPIAKLHEEDDDER